MVNRQHRPPAAGRPAALPSLADRAYDAIRDRLGLSRTPVREALKRLEHERLVVSYPRRGTFATEINVTDLTHISEVRELIEPAAAASAARHATPADRESFRVLLGELAAAGAAVPAAELMNLDTRVHRAVYAATRNPYLEDTLIRYNNLATRIWCLFLDRLAGMAGHVAEHRLLLEALLAGDDRAAAAIARRHVTGFDQAIRAVI